MERKGFFTISKIGLLTMLSRENSGLSGEYIISNKVRKGLILQG